MRGVPSQLLASTMSHERHAPLAINTRSNNGLFDYVLKVFGMRGNQSQQLA